MYHEHHIETVQADIDYPAKTVSCATCSIPSKLVLPLPDGIMTGTDQGIVAHSTDERYVIVAIDRQTKLGKQVFEEWLKSENINFKPLLGKYSGVIEYSYIINVRNWIKVRDSGFVSNQSAVLYLWSHAYGYADYGIDARKATLYNTASGFGADLGPFVAINTSELDAFDDWSFDISTDTYYVVKPMIGKKI